jgi:hypothetical protein
LLAPFTLVIKVVTALGSEILDEPLPPPQATRIAADVRNRPRAIPVFLEAVDKLNFSFIFFTDV